MSNHSSVSRVSRPARHRSPRPRAAILVLSFGALLSPGCRGATGDGQSGGTDDSTLTTDARQRTASDISPCATRPLTAADVAQYASVMHAAVDRWHDLPASDRAALAAARSLDAQGSNPDPATIASMGDRLQRATELMTGMDRVIARERHIPIDCYDAIAERIETVVPDPATLASGDAADTSASAGVDPARRQAALAQEHSDSLVVGTRRAELQPLIHNVRMGHLAE